MSMEIRFRKVFLQMEHQTKWIWKVNHSKHKLLPLCIKLNLLCGLTEETKIFCFLWYDPLLPCLLRVLHIWLGTGIFDGVKWLASVAKLFSAVALRGVCVCRKLPQWNLDYACIWIACWIRIQDLIDSFFLHLSSVVSLPSHKSIYSSLLWKAIEMMMLPENNSLGSDKSQTNQKRDAQMELNEPCNVAK